MSPSNAMPIFDAHVDLLDALCLKPGANFKTPSTEGPVASLPALQKGNVRFFCMSLFGFDVADEAFWMRLGFAKAILDLNPEIFVPVTDAASLKKVQKEKGKIGSLLWVENLAVKNGEPEAIAERLFTLGVRGVILAWKEANRYSAVCGEKKGLTPEGRRFVKAANRLGISMDLSHLSDRASEELLERAERVSATHANMRACCDNRRNLPDPIAKKLYARKGPQGFLIYPPFLGAPKTESPFPKFFEHLDHALELGGADSLGFGSDFDGMFGNMYSEFDTPGKFGTLAKLIVRRYGVRLAEKICWKNWFNAMLKG